MEKETPLVSIVIPVYNVEQYLPDCMKSIIDQTYRNLEIILVDDGSTDKSGILCDKIAEEDTRIQVIHKKNGGLSDARNVGIQNVHGEFLMFVDSDDQIDKRMVEILFNSMAETGSDVAICDPVHVFSKDDLVYTVSTENRLFDAKSAICEMWYQKSFLPSAWGKLYKTELIKSTEFRVGILYEDIDMMHQVFCKSDRIVYNLSKLYAYQHREGSITTKKFSKRDCEILNICDRLKKFAENEGEELQKAAKAYGVVGALRIELNAPDSPEFIEEKQRAKACIQADWREVLHDKNVRKKTKIGLLLYKCCRPLMQCVYARINRWK